MNSMKSLGKAVVIAATMATLVTASAFAETRNQDRTRRDRDGRRNAEDRAYRNNERVTVEGRVRSFSRQRDGYRIELDRGRHSYWVPSSYFRGRNRGRDLRVGVSLRLGGVFRGGYVYVDSLDWMDRGGYNDRNYDRGAVRGIITDVDYRRGILELRDEYSGRYVRVDMRRAGRDNRGVDLNDLRRGDYVTLAGDWDRGVFEAYRIESVRSGRW